jgi:hypothetical protein
MAKAKAVEAINLIMRFSLQEVSLSHTIVVAARNIMDPLRAAIASSRSSLAEGRDLLLCVSTPYRMSSDGPRSKFYPLWDAITPQHRFQFREWCCAFAHANAASVAKL